MTELDPESTFQFHGIEVILWDGKYTCHIDNGSNTDSFPDINKNNRIEC